MKIKYKNLLVVIGILVTSFAPVLASAHPGRTDSSGCHTCRTNCPSWGLSSGEYHCHNAKAVPQPLEPIRSHYGEGGTGYTQPWPAYKSSTIVPQASNTSKLKRGMSGTEVSKLQAIIAKDTSIYPEGLITGNFGPATERAVMRFQKKYGLEQVGYVGPKTRELLNNF